MINIVVIKERINKLLLQRYDHKFLNTDTPPFDQIVPTYEYIARELLKEVGKLFESDSAKPVICHISEDSGIDVTAFSNEKIERSYHLDFSAARRTFSPHLTDEENEKLFGASARKNGHGHHYQIRLTTDKKVDEKSGVAICDSDVSKVLKKLFEKYDHSNLNTDISEFINMPVTTESLTKLIFEETQNELPINRIRINENDYFFIEYNRDGQMSMGVKSWFHAAHRLHSSHLSDDENLKLYGKCNNPSGHGHMYKLEILVDGKYDEKSGTVYDLMDVLSELKNSFADWDYKHLNNEVSEFSDIIPTGENIITVLWNKFDKVFGDDLNRLSLWETANNRFTIRRSIKG